MKVVPIISFLLLLWINAAFSQSKHTISGYVKDGSTGEYSIGATIYLKENLKGTTTNAYGFYSITVEEGSYTFVVSYLGYDDYRQQVQLNKDLRINVSLNIKTITTQEVVITGEAANKNIQSTEMGTIRMEVKDIKLMPVLMGEVDVLKAIQLLPGVQAAGEGSSGFYVRGGGPDQNLILLDEAIVYNPGHLFGFFSIFNADAIKDINLFKGGMPANYGGRLASVLDITMNDGNTRKYVVEGGVGVISSRLTLQGPLKKDTSSFIVTARRTYIDVLVQPFIKDSSPLKGSGYYFYDLNAKVNYRVSDRDRFFLSGYSGKDVFTHKNSKAGFNASIPWGNSTGSFRWNHLFTKKLFMNATAVFSDYRFEFKAEEENFEFRLFSGIQDWNAKFDFNYFPSVLHNVKFGGIYIYHTFTPGTVSARINNVEFDLNKIIRQYAHEAALYVNDDFDLNSWLKINAGVRYSYFMQVGPFDRYIKNYFDEITDTIHYNTGEKVAEYQGAEPRLTARFKLNESTSIKAAYTQNYQYLHLAAISSVSLPTDLWVPSSDIVKPQFGIQYATGIFKNFMDNRYEASVEIYYKTMKNLVEFKEGSQPEGTISDNTDNGFTFGEGESYGSEFFIARKKGKWHGWIGYTLAWTNRTFPEINGGETFPAKYDRRHDFEMVFNYDLNDRWSFSSVFVYSTGNAATMPLSRYVIEGNLVVEYGVRNSYRMPSYHRADISATWYFKKANEGWFGSAHHTRIEHNLNFSVYNVYDHYNPYFIYFAQEGNVYDGTLSIRAKQVSLFPIMPSVAWNFKF